MLWQYYTVYGQLLPCDLTLVVPPPRGDEPRPSPDDHHEVPSLDESK